MKKISGVITAIIAPFENGKLDLVSFEKLVLDQLRRGITGFVINGTTGESPTVSSEEHQKLFHLARKLVPSDFPLIYGTGSNSTEKTIEQTSVAQKSGADAALIVVPYYNKPPQRGLAEHFKAVADATNIPIILYNVPSRTITALELSTIQELSKHPRIIGIKEASGNIEFARQIRQTCGPQFLLLSGDDGTYDQFAHAGGDGVISVASHIIPEAMSQKKATEHLDLINMLFCEANPIPVKMALKLTGILKSAELRLPLVSLGSTETEKLKVEMRKKGLLS